MKVLKYFGWASIAFAGIGWIVLFTYSYGSFYRHQSEFFDAMYWCWGIGLILGLAKLFFGPDVAAKIGIAANLSVPVVSFVIGAMYVSH